jgi:hypothetical protein
VSLNKRMDKKYCRLLFNLKKEVSAGRRDTPFVLFSIMEPLVYILTNIMLSELSQTEVKILPVLNMC